MGFIKQTSRLLNVFVQKFEKRLAKRHTCSTSLSEQSETSDVFICIIIRWRRMCLSLLIGTPLGLLMKTFGLLLFSKCICNMFPNRFEMHYDRKFRTIGRAHEIRKSF